MITSPEVVPFGDTLRMYYSGSVNANGSESAIGMATSEDGVNWERDENNPIFAPSEDGWDSNLVRHPMILERSDRFLMFYAGHNKETTPEMSSAEACSGSQLGFAASWDGLEWERCGDTLVPGGGAHPFAVAEADGSLTLYFSHRSAACGGSGGLKRMVWSNWP